MSPSENKVIIIIIIIIIIIRYFIYILNSCFMYGFLLQPAAQ